MRPKPRRIRSTQVYDKRWMRVREGMAELPNDTEFLQPGVLPFGKASRVALEGEIMDRRSVPGRVLAARRRGDD